VIALQSWLGAGMFIVAHDAIHGSLAPGRRKINATVGQIAVGLYAGFGLRKLAKAHLDHHRAPGTFADPDFHPEGSPAFAAWFLNFFRHYFGWPEMARISAVVALYVFVLGAKPMIVGLFWGLPALCSALQLFVFGTYLPHRPERRAFVDTSRSRSLDYPWLLSLLSCFHFGRHREHHGHPDVPWWRLPSVRLN
jgi:beta-carotene ketolase (CrtW type)